MAATFPGQSHQTLSLPSGRTLGYAIYGIVTGRPLLYFHGFPSSRLEAYAFHRVAVRHRLRLIAIDRPGFGLSTHDPNRRIPDFSADVLALTSHLNLTQLAVLGVSGGGPYALACAKQLPHDKLTAVGIIAGATPWDKGVRTGGVHWYSRLLYVMAHYLPLPLRLLSVVLVRTLGWIVRTDMVGRWIDSSLEAVWKARAAKDKKSDGAAGGTVEAEDEEAAPTAERRKRLIALLLEGFAQGIAGFALEARLLSSDWGFRLEDVGFDKVQMWHGVRDTNVPIAGVRTMAARIPYCELKIYDEDHYTMGDRFEEILGELLPERDPRPNKAGKA